MANEWVLVTGYPSLQARRLVSHVLAEEPATHVALVVSTAERAKADEHLARLGSDLARLELFEGDCSSLDMGLSGAELRSLARRVTRIHHLAHEARSGANRKAARLVNVQGAIEVLELARLCDSLECLVHHSTAHVSGDRTGVIFEDDLDEGQSFHDAVHETRMEAELVMRRSMRHVPIAVVRPTLMVGASDTGEAEHLDGPYLLAMLLLALPGDVAVPLPTGSDNPLDIVPVDFVVKAARHLGRRREARGRTFHLGSSEELTAQQVFDVLARAGGRRTTRGLLPSQLAVAISKTPAVARFLREPRALIQQLTRKARYDRRNAERLLAGSDILCPPLESYAGSLVAKVQERLNERHPARATMDPEN